MADAKLTALTSSGAIAAADQWYVVQSGASRVATGTQLTTFVWASPTLVTPVIGVATMTSLNKVAFTAPATAATLAFGTDSATITFQGTDTYVGRATTDTLTNKTLTSPTLTTPALGVATATSINKVIFTTPTTAGTITFGTDSAVVTFQGTDTYVGRATTDTLTNKTLTSPTLTTPALGVATATSVAIGGATIGSDGLGITGTASISGQTNFGASTVYTAASAGPTLKQGANGRCGTFVANGVTPVSISNTSVAITDTIIISLNTIGGTVGVQPHVATITASTGFDVVCTAADTSTYNYAIIKNAA